MKNKLEFLTKISLKRKISSKWFYVANILLALIIVAVINIDSIITLFGGDFNEEKTLYVLDNTDYAYDILKNNFDTMKESYGLTSYNIEKTQKDIQEEIKDDNKKIELIITKDEENVISAKLISNEFIDTLDYQMIYQSISSTKNVIATSQLGLTEKELSKLYGEVKIDRLVLDEDKKSEDENMEMIMTTVFPIVILPFFMLTIFLTQMIGSEINDEKTTRGMEIIISNVSPKTHLLSKILSGNIFVLLQGFLLILYFVIGLLIRYLTQGSLLSSGMGESIYKLATDMLGTGFINKLFYIIPLTLLLMIFTFIAYSLLAGVLASMTTNAEDFGQLQTPIMLISLAGYYLAMMAGMFKGSLFIRIFSYIPLISAILSPSLLVIGQIGIIDVIISMVLVLLFIALLIKYGLRVYKIGILNYSSKDLWKKMFKAIKQK